MKRTSSLSGERLVEACSACEICGCALRPFGQAQLLGKYTVGYFQCTGCGYTRTEEPYWLDEAYADAINESDVGLVSRNQVLARITKAAITAFFRRDARFIDYGGGYGLFVRMMRDYGFDYYWQDKHCANLFAKIAPADLSGGSRYELLTAFEVFEHLPHPAAELPQMLALSENILFTTQLIPEQNPRPGYWWYYGLDHGQHVSLYTRRSLEVLAARYGRRFYSDGRFIHLMVRKQIAPRVFTLVTNYYVASLLSVLYRRPSLVEIDYQKVTGRPLR